MLTREGRSCCDSLYLRGLRIQAPVGLVYSAVDASSNGVCVVEMTSHREGCKSTENAVSIHIHSVAEGDRVYKAVCVSVQCRGKVGEDVKRSYYPSGARM